MPKMITDYTGWPLPAYTYTCTCIHTVDGKSLITPLYFGPKEKCAQRLNTLVKSPDMTSR